MFRKSFEVTLEEIPESSTVFPRTTKCFNLKRFHNGWCNIQQPTVVITFLRSRAFSLLASASCLPAKRRDGKIIINATNPPLPSFHFNHSFMILFVLSIIFCFYRILLFVDFFLNDNELLIRQQPFLSLYKIYIFVFHF